MESSERYKITFQDGETTKYFVTHLEIEEFRKVIQRGIDYNVDRGLAVNPSYLAILDAIDNGNYKLININGKSRGRKKKSESQN